MLAGRDGLEGDSYRRDGPAGGQPQRHSRRREAHARLSQGTCMVR